MFSFAQVQVSNGSSYMVLLSELPSILADELLDVEEGTVYTITIVYMSLREYDELREFEGVI